MLTNILCIDKCTAYWMLTNIMLYVDKCDPHVDSVILLVNVSMCVDKDDV